MVGWVGSVLQDLRVDGCKKWFKSGCDRTWVGMDGL